ncbi:PREDICTED: kelch-like protein 24 [Branchiostoma belcheri]|uniref:Kelch-like protein 24 n=1 Tax=Branchiostoma belcheri TaxID=7741 RepID=A0A6P4Z1Y2_BRABE|nr:PREDICTED: kelch-like protein 24 [Branchiostoma belcheri]XP_019625094.1 PREDICTED: kelch-like protein 24 [Branchiostoma belcheri]
MADNDSLDPVDGLYAAWFFDELRTMRSGGLLVDVTLCAEGKEIPCHRLVLAACSDYFQAMFSGGLSESRKDKIEIGGVSAEALQMLVDFAYTSRITLNDDNVQSLFITANMLQIVTVENACEKFLIENVSPDTCIGIWALADRINCEELADTARHCALKNFEEACKAEEFLQLPFDLFERLVSDDCLHAKKEERVLEVVMLWVRHDLEERQKHLKELLECISFSSMDRDYLKNVLKKDKVLAKVPGIKELTKDKSLHISPRIITQNDILVLGGVKNHSMNGNVSFNESVCRLELDSHCVESNPLPQELQGNFGFAACVFNEDIIVTGGSQSARQAWRHKPSQKTWNRLGSLKKGRFWHGMAVVEGRVYIVGGHSRGDNVENRMLRDVEVYNERTNRWNKAAPLLQAVSNFGLTACQGRLYVFGGVVDPVTRNETDAVQCYDPLQKKWMFKMRMPTAMGNIKACTVDIDIFLVGGGFKCAMLFHDGGEDDTYYEDLADTLVPWDHCSATVCGFEIYITGGQTKPELFTVRLSERAGNLKFLRFGNHATVQCYDTIFDTMVKVQDMPFALDGHCTVTVPKD